MEGFVRIDITQHSLGLGADGTPDSPTCQRAALHGLGHLHHPQTPQLIQRYLDERPSLTNDWKQYALAAAEFKVM